MALGVDWKHDLLVTPVVSPLRLRLFRVNLLVMFRGGFKLWVFKKLGDVGFGG